MEYNNQKIFSFKDMVAWQQSRKLAVLIYRITKNFPTEERFGIVDQMRRASISVSSCLAEGFSRKSNKDKTHFYIMSLGSLTELQSQIIISGDLDYISKDTVTTVEAQIILVSKLINGLCKALR